jgi:hypothetical protein
MHTPPANTSTNDNTSHISRRAVQPSRDDHAPPAHDREDVQRFRRLMDGRPGNGEDDDSGDSAMAGTVRLSPEQEQSLRELLQRQLGENQAGMDPLRSRSEDDGDQGDGQGGQDDGQHAQTSIGMLALHQAQLVMQQNVEQPAPANNASLAPALAELIERHVKQLLVPDASSSSAAQSREIMITLKDGLLPGTELWLSRSDNGWTLRADTRSSAAYRSLVEGAPQLIERFANSRLGELSVQPTLLD